MLLKNPKAVRTLADVGVDASGAAFYSLKSSEGV